jgi:hypothetical protein
VKILDSIHYRVDTVQLRKSRTSRVINIRRVIPRINKDFRRSNHICNNPLVQVTTNSNSSLHHKRAIRQVTRPRSLVLILFIPVSKTLDKFDRRFKVNMDQVFRIRVLNMVDILLKVHYSEDTGHRDSNLHRAKPTTRMAVRTIHGSTRACRSATIKPLGFVAKYMLKLLLKLAGLM